MRLFAALFLLLLISGKAYSTSTVIRVGVFEDQVPFINANTDFQGCVPLAEAKVGENQMLLEYLLFCNFVKEVQPDIEFQLIGFPVTARVVNALADGSIDANGFGAWSGEALNESVSLSEPLLRHGEFEKGLFATEKTLRQFEINGTKLLPQLIAVSNENWTYDWQQLACSPMNVIHVGSYFHMFNILEVGRADVLPMAFGAGDDLTRTEFGIQLTPLPGIKLIVPDSSHFAVSKKSPYYALLMNALNSGLEKLRVNQDLRNLYLSIGVLNPHVQEWDSICSSQ